MARLAGGGGIQDFAVTIDGTTGDITPAVSATITFWDALDAGNQYTGRPDPDDGTGLTDGSGAPIDSVTTDTTGFIADGSFLFPDLDVTSVTRMAADANAGAGPRRWIYPNDPVSVSLGARQAVSSQTASLSVLNQFALLTVVYNTATSSYPPRPSGIGAPILWIGPVQPTIGGSGAVDNLDFFMGPAS